MTSLYLDKRWLTHERQGVRYLYLPRQSTGVASHHALANVVKTFFGGSRSRAVAA